MSAVKRQVHDDRDATERNLHHAREVLKRIVAEATACKDSGRMLDAASIIEIARSGLRR